MVLLRSQTGLVLYPAVPFSGSASLSKLFNLSGHFSWMIQGSWYYFFERLWGLNEMTPLMLLAQDLSKCKNKAIIFQTGFSPTQRSQLPVTEPNTWVFKSILWNLFQFPVCKLYFMQSSSTVVFRNMFFKCRVLLLLINFSWEEAILYSKLCSKQHIHILQQWESSWFLLKERKKGERESEGGRKRKKKKGRPKSFPTEDKISHKSV